GANQALGNSIDSFATILNSKDGGDAAAAIRSLDNGMAKLNGVPPLDEQADLFRERLLRLLAEYKAMIQSYAQGEQKDRRKAVNDHNALVKSYDAFWEEYRPWITKYLEDHGLKLEQPGDNR
ncbi:MAG TPA: hypothetical protein VF747_09385, partial [Blastocatellia bacterium]